jgi:hypothetical protein
MGTRNESTLERRRRQLEVIGRKLQGAIDRKDEAAQNVHRLSYEATEQNIRELEAEGEQESPRRRSRREG